MQKIIIFIIPVFLLIFISCSKKENTENLLEPTTKIIYAEKPVDVKNNFSSDKEVTENTIVPDIDLTKMSATMIYSTVFQFLIDFENYEGKIIRIRGGYTPFFREETQRIYHNVVIQDATACCKEGLEFVLGDGSHPDSDYPKKDQEIIVTGVFEQYYEDDKMEVMQIRLKNASMEIVQ